MPKFLNVLLVALLVSSCQCGGVQKVPKNPSAVVSHVSNSTVALVYTNVKVPEVDCDKQCPPDKDDDDDTEPPKPIVEVRSFCTGVWISKSVIVTAKHCVVGLAEHEKVGDPENVVMHYTTSFEAPQSMNEPYGMHLASVLAIDPDEDIALIRAAGGKNMEAIPVHEVAEITGQLPGVGEDLWVVGMPRGEWFSLVKGSVSAYRTNLDGDEGHWLQAQAPLFYGNSGGGAFDKDGKLVGIASSLSLYPSGMFAKGIVPEMTWFVDANAIRKLVENSAK